MKNQFGNALFLILIAVALFAALSYAVTQSTRDGKNTSEEEQSIEVAEYLQKITQLRLAIQRMNIIQGLTNSEIKLCETIAACDTEGVIDSVCSTGSTCLFSSDGGGVDINIFENFIQFFEAGIIPLPGYNLPIGMNSHIAYVPGGLHTGHSETYCKQLQSAVGLSETLEEELTDDSVFTDGIASLQGQWDFCYDGDPSPSVTRYSAVHILVD